MSHNKLRGRIVEKFGSVKKFSEKLGKKQQTVNLKVQGKVGFSRKEIIEWSNLLEILPDDCYSYFIE